MSQVNGKEREGHTDTSMSLPRAPAPLSPILNRHDGGNSSDTDGNAITPVVASDEKIENVNKPVFKATRSHYLAFGSLMILTLAVALDATTLSVALPIISSALGGNALEAFWSGTSFLLASTVLQPSVAALSSIFGRKNMIFIMCFLFGAGSLMAALAGNFAVIIGGRTIQGIGGGGVVALTEVVITDMVPLAFRPTWLSILSSMWSVGTVTGPLVGAGFAQNISWRWIFYINLPMIGLGLLLVVIFLHQAKIPGGIMHKLGRFDWIGSILFTASSTSFLYGITTGGVQNPWSSVKVLLPLIIGPFGILLFGVYEFRWAAEPIVHRNIFANWDMVLSYTMTVFHGIILWSLLYLLPLYYQGVQGYSPVISAVAVLPETLTVAPAAALVGVIAGITGKYRWSLVTGWALTTLGLGLLQLLKPDSSVPQWIFLNIPGGIGTGMLFPAMGLSIQASVRPELNAQATAFFSFMRSFGQSIGVAISGVIFQNAFHKKLLATPGFDAAQAKIYSLEATSVANNLKAMPSGPAKTALIKAYSDSFGTVFVAMVAFSAFCTVLSVFITSRSLEQEHITNQSIVQGGQANSSNAKEEKTGADV